jgi:mono/diheme cytochrome c family protein
MSKARRVLKGVGVTLAVVFVLAGALFANAALRPVDALRPGDVRGPALSASTDPAVIERGRYLVHGPAHCVQCHTTSDRNRPEQIPNTPLRGGLAFHLGPLGTRYARNLTAHATGIAGLSDAQLARSIRTGVMYDGELSILMRFAGAQLSDEDLVAVLSYLRSLAPVANAVPQGHWTPAGKAILRYAFPKIEPRTAQGPAHVPAGEAPTVERGRYLADHVMMCAACHTTLDEGTMRYTGPPHGGSAPEPSHGDDAHMEFVAPNLTSHPTGVVGRLTEDAFVARMRGGRVYRSSIMPWESFARTTDVDLRSVYRYLRTIPPAARDVGPTYRTRGWQPPG